MKKIRIAQIVFSLDQGGLENGVVNVVNNADESRIEQVVVCLGKRGILADRVKSGVKVYKLDEGANDLVTAFKLNQIIRKERIDIIHARNWNTLPAAVIAKIISRVPILVHSFHGFLPDETFPLRRRIFVKLCSYFIDMIFTVTDDASRRWRKVNWLSKKKIVTIHNGVDTNKFYVRENDVEFKRSLGLIGQCKVIGIIGSLTAVKNHKVFLEAAKKIINIYADSQFVIVGDGSLRKELEEYSQRLGIGDKVVFTGRREDVSALINCMDIVVNCSTLEGMNNVLLEAMASGKPVVATTVGGNLDILKHEYSGLFCRAGDGDDLAATISRVLSDSDLSERLAVQARENVVNRFSLKKMLLNYQDMYLCLCYRKSKKLCLVAPFPPPFGGMSVQAEKIAQNLEKEGVVYKRVNTSRVLPGVLGIKGVRTIINMLHLFVRLFLKASDTNTFYVFSCSYGYFFLTTVPAWIVAKITRRKIIINYHGGLAREFLKKYRFFVKPVLKSADVVVVPSEFLKDVFKEFGIESKVILNVIEFDGLFKKRENLEPSLVVTRHHDKEYAVGCAIETFRLLQEEIPQARLTIVGEGKETLSLQKKVKESNIRNVLFMGRIKNNDMGEVLRKHDIFLNTSLVDNLPVSFLEAFAAGLLVVSTPAGGIPYLVKNRWNGLLSETYEPKDIVKQIKSALNLQKESISMIENAQEFVKRFSWSAVRDDLLEVMKV
jgi:L-malate glycosyltransferase